MDTPILTSTKPYLIRALYDWINDNQCTPYVIINAEANDVIALGIGSRMKLTKRTSVNFEYIYVDVQNFKI